MRAEYRENEIKGEEVMAESGMHVINTKEKMWVLIATRSRAVAMGVSG